MSSDLNLECLDVIGKKMRLECSIQLHQNPNMEISLLPARAWFKAPFSNFQYQLESIYKRKWQNYGTRPQLVETNEKPAGKSLVLFSSIVLLSQRFPNHETKLFSLPNPESGFR